MKNKNLMRGVLYLAIGAFLIYWALSHSPADNVGKMINNKLTDTYSLDDTWYYLTLLIGILSTAFGGFQTYKELK